MKTLTELARTLFGKSQLNLFGGATTKQKPPARAKSHVKLPSMGPKFEPKIGDTKHENGKDYIFLETTIGKPRWHTVQEVGSMAMRGQKIPDIAVQKFPDLKADIQVGEDWKKKQEEGEGPQLKRKFLEGLKRRLDRGEITQEQHDRAANKKWPHEKNLIEEFQRAEKDDQDANKAYRDYVERFEEGHEYTVEELKEVKRLADARDKTHDELIGLARKIKNLSPAEARKMRDDFVKNGTKEKSTDEAINQRVAAEKSKAQKPSEEKPEPKKEEPAKEPKPVKPEATKQTEKEPEPPKEEKPEGEKVLAGKMDREKMPQINQRDFQLARYVFRDMGIGFKRTYVPSHYLMPMQSGVPTPKEGEKETTLIPPIVISKDNYIIDGHRRWVHYMSELGKEKEIPAYRIDENHLSALDTYRKVSEEVAKIKQRQNNVPKEHILAQPDKFYFVKRTIDDAVGMNFANDELAEAPAELVHGQISYIEIKGKPLSIPGHEYADIFTAKVQSPNPAYHTYAAYEGKTGLLVAGNEKRLKDLVVKVKERMDSTTKEKFEEMVGHALERQGSISPRYQGGVELPEPKEGDTKIVNGVTYILTEGNKGLRWRRATKEEAQDQPEQPEEIKDLHSVAGWIADMNHEEITPDNRETYHRQAAMEIVEGFKNLEEAEETLRDFGDRKGELFFTARGHGVTKEALRQAIDMRRENIIDDFITGHPGIGDTGLYVISYNGQTYEFAEEREDRTLALFRKVNGEIEGVTLKADDVRGVVVESIDDYMARTGQTETEMAEKPKATEPNIDSEKRTRRKKYVDVGEKIGGARKDLWAEKLAEGETLDIGDVDLERLEENPGMAHKLIQKKNFLQRANEMIEQFKEMGYEAPVVFLLGKLNSVIAQQPDDTPTARKQYMSAIDLMKKRVFAAKTLAELEENIQQLRRYGRGYEMTADELERIKTLEEQIRPLQQEYHNKSDIANPLEMESRNLEAEASKFTRRRKPVPPDLQARVDAARSKWNEAAVAAGEARQKFRPLSQEVYTIQSNAVKRSESNPFSMMNLLKSLGEPFMKAIGAQYGDSAFHGHLATAKRMAADDWTWLKESAKEVTRRKSVDRLPDWKREVPEEVERVGSSVPDTFEAKDMMEHFGMRGVEYGNWMDDASSKKHTSLAGQAMYDLAEVLGIDPKKISYNGRLALAFGARGEGLTGAAAHYEPLKTVINFTKFSGGGTVAHEWAHFFDNIIAKLSHDETIGRAAYGSELDYGDSIPTAVKDAMRDIVKQMNDGDHRLFHSIGPNPKMEKYRWRSFDGLLAEGKSAQDIFDKHYEALRLRYDSDRKYYEKFTGDAYSEKRLAKKTKKFERDVKEAAEYLATKSGKRIKTPFKGGVGTSRYKANAMFQPTKTTYWSSGREMFARAFEAYIHDKMEARGVKNTYLVYGAHDRAKAKSAIWVFFDDEKGMYSAYMGERRSPDHLPLAPFPEGEERQRINAAIDRFMDAVKTSDLLSKSIQLLEAQQITASLEITDAELNEAIGEINA